MPNTNYGDISPRTAAYAAKELLKRGVPYLVLEKFGQAKPLPEGNSKTITFRRYTALPTNIPVLTEGVTPAGQVLAKTDIPATLDQYGDKVTITDVVMDTHEDPVLSEATELLGEQAAQVIERMRFGKLVLPATNVFYAGGVASRNLVNSALTRDVQRRAIRAIKRQNGRPVTSIVRSTPAFGTEAVAPAFIGLIHPDVERDVRMLEGFVPAEKYGTITPWENEIGKCEDVRYLSSTVFEPWVGAGATKGAMIGAGANADVYPVLYLAANAYGIVALKGAFAVTPMVVNPKPSDSDPLAQRGHVGWKTMQTCVILNDAWMARCEVAATN